MWWDLYCAKFIEIEIVHCTALCTQDSTRGRVGHNTVPTIINIMLIPKYSFIHFLQNSKEIVLSIDFFVKSTWIALTEFNSYSVKCLILTLEMTLTISINFNIHDTVFHCTKPNTLYIYIIFSNQMCLRWISFFLIFMNNFESNSHSQWDVSKIIVMTQKKVIITPKTFVYFFKNPTSHSPLLHCFFCLYPLLSYIGSQWSTWYSITT